MAAPRARFSRKKTEKIQEVNENSLRYVNDCWCPRASVVFNVLLSARITAAFLSNISDCDETFNYWEPTHYLMYGNGFQTWEYSPRYAIRSYAYLFLHILPAQVVKQFFRANKMTVFYYVRFILGIVCAACETYFFSSLKYQFGNNVARLYFIFSVCCTGMFISAAAFLPSSFAMYCCLIAFGGWFNKNYPENGTSQDADVKNQVAIFGIALGSLVGWPFFAILGVPIAFDIVFRQRQFWSFVQWCIGIFLAIMIPLVAVDTHYYGKRVIAPLNIVLYNVFGGGGPDLYVDTHYYYHRKQVVGAPYYRKRVVIAPLNIVLYNVFGGGGPDLYGIESWKFYFINGFLNLNIAFIMALMAFPFLLVANMIHKKHLGEVHVCSVCGVPQEKDILKLPTWLIFSPMILWILIFFTRPHKEERFLFPIYPLLLLSAALMLSRFQEKGTSQDVDVENQELYHFMLTRTSKHHFTSSSNWLCCTILLVFSIISLSRSAALYAGYHAPLDIYPELHELVTPVDPEKNPLFDYGKRVNVCVGREWYRYPSSFFLPDNWRFLFIKSEFSGQLPQQYSSGADGTKVIPKHMNDMNEEEPAAYSTISDCDLLIDIDLPTKSEHEENYSQNKKEWEVLQSRQFLDASRSHPFFRAFYIPFVSEKHSFYVNYNLLLSRRNKRRFMKIKRRRRSDNEN